MDHPERPTPPDHGGGSLVNLMAEIEWRMTGRALAPRLHRDLAEVLPEAETYLVVLFDGLGAHQLAHEAASPLAGAQRAIIDAPFPTTTTVSLASIATATTPGLHGWFGHVVWVPELGETVNSLKWFGRGGKPVSYDTETFTPRPNLWERLSEAGREPITIQPGHFGGSPLSRAIYRGARFESVWSTDEIEDAAITLASQPHRLLLAYFPQVDFAAHLHGQKSDEYAEAVQLVASSWDRLASRLPTGTVMVGTADHGHIDYRQRDKHIIDRRQAGSLNLFGDPRALYAKGTDTDIAALEARLPATWHPIESMES